MPCRVDAGVYFRQRFRSPVCLLGAAIQAIRETEKGLSDGIRERYRPIIDKSNFGRAPSLGALLVAFGTKSVIRWILASKFRAT